MRENVVKISPRRTGGEADQIKHFKIVAFLKIIFLVLNKPKISPSRTFLYSIILYVFQIKTKHFLAVE